MTNVMVVGSLELGTLGDIDAAHHHAQAAMDYYESVGNRMQLEAVRADLAGIYLNVLRFVEVIEPAERAL